MQFHGKIPLALILATGMQVACSAEQSQPQVQSSEHKHVVRMTDEMRFVPERLTVAAGDTIVWINDGSIPHTSTDSPGAAGVPEHNILPVGAEPWDSQYLNAGETFRLVVDSPGTYTYLCVIHETAGMIGHLTVEGS